MRLVCPNCDAQYEVDDAAIPEAGRDVQCSNCGHAWFQRHPEVVADEEFEDEIFLSDDEVPPPAPVVAAPPTPAVVPEPEPEPEEPAPVAAAEPMVEVVQDEDDGPEPPPAAMQDAPARKPALDESLMAVLREEAEREAAVRRVEEPQQRIETQTDLGLTSAPPPPPVPASVLAARERFADLSVDRVEADEDEGEIVTRPTSRRELLPDIEEINSTLRASSEPRGEGEHLPLPPVMVVDGRAGLPQRVHADASDRGGALARVCDGTADRHADTGKCSGDGCLCERGEQGAGQCRCGTAIGEQVHP